MHIIFSLKKNTLMRFALVSCCVMGSLVQADQICRTEQGLRTPDEAFVLHADGTVTHKTSDLMWMRCSLGQRWQAGRCLGRADNLTWPDAMAEADRIRFADYADWRLPTLRELSSIIDHSCRSPAINLRTFPDTPTSWYWSSTRYAYQNTLSWGVYFDMGYQDYSGRYLPSHVRLVRSAGSGD